MKKDVLIAISGQQFYEDMNNEKIELLTKGRYYRKKGDYYITYQESELTGLAGTTTTLKVEDKVVTMVRRGLYPTQMIFEKGKRYVSMYDTGEGAMTIAVNTNSIDNRLTDSGGSIEINYAIEVDHAIAGINIFRMDIKDSGEKIGLMN